MADPERDTLPHGIKLPSRRPQPDTPPVIPLHVINKTVHVRGTKNSVWELACGVFLGLSMFATVTAILAAAYIEYILP